MRSGLLGGRLVYARVVLGLPSYDHTVALAYGEAMTEMWENCEASRDLRPSRRLRQPAIATDLPSSRSRNPSRSSRKQRREPSHASPLRKTRTNRAREDGGAGVEPGGTALRPRRRSRTLSRSAVIQRD